MNKKASSPLVFLSGIIIIIIGSLNILAWIILFNFIKSVKTPPQFLIPLLDTSSYYLRHPFQIFILLITVGVGVILVIASKKMKQTEKLFHWSIISLVLGLVILFELKGDFLGVKTAGILSSLGGIFGLIEAKNKS